MAQVRTMMDDALSDHALTIAAIIRREYGMRIQAVLHLKTVFGLVTTDGQRYIWKFVRPLDSELRLNYLFKVAMRLQRQGITLAGPLPNLRDRLITEMDGEGQGYLQSWVAGRHLRVESRVERLTAVQTVANLHKWAGSVDEGQFPAGPGGILPIRLKAKKAALSHGLAIVGDRIPGLATVTPTLLRMADEAVRAGVQATPGLEFRFCHRDLAPHNLLWSRQGRVGIIDLDRAGWDDPLLDLLQLFNHSLFLDAPKVGYLDDMLQAYQRESPLPSDRIDVFYKLAGFPEYLTRALVEWVNEGCPPERRLRVELALVKEQHRRRLLAQLNDGGSVHV